MFYIFPAESRHGIRCHGQSLPILGLSLVNTLNTGLLLVNTLNTRLSLVNSMCCDHTLTGLDTLNSDYGNRILNQSLKASENYI